jgi:hypothetical protein
MVASPSCYHFQVETIGDAYMVSAGHDEDEDKGRKGSPLMRVLGFARAMLDVVRNITAPNGERMRIRIVSEGSRARSVPGGVPYSEPYQKRRTWALYGRRGEARVWRAHRRRGPVEKHL